MTAQRSALDLYPEFEATIGVEVHVQLLTERKIFCWCKNEVCAEPNRNICQICTGQPGTLPVANRRVVDYAIMAGLATNCTITNCSTFSRKHYFYPDLPKGYQITQGELPICLNGYVPIRLKNGQTKKIRLHRIHMEEDAGKNIHMSDGTESFVNFNRAGTPLLEIVTEPDISSAYEVKQYLKTLHQIVRYLGICSGNMEEGAFRADTNISVKRKSDIQLGTRCELKNINSFKFIADATEYEIERQLELIHTGGTVVQETRLWDTKRRMTVPMRTKEGAADYRYLDDPDLPEVVIDQQWIAQIQQQIPELPQQRLDTLRTLGLSEYEADILLDDPELCDYFLIARKHTESTHLINWVLRDLMGLLKAQKITIAECKITPEKLARIVQLLSEDAINGPAAKQVFEAIADTGADPDQIIQERGLQQIGSIDELEAIVLKIIKNNPKNVAAYKGGKERLFGFFVGQAMKETTGKGNPKLIQELLKKHLA